MKKGFICVKEDEIEQIANCLGRCSSDIEGTSCDVRDNFSGMSQAGLLGDGIQKIGNQFKALSGSMRTMQHSILKNIDNLKGTEKMLSAKANEIYIPKDFVKNDTSQSISIAERSLNKQDGKSVNEGNSSQNVDLELNSSLAYNNKLKIILNSYEQKANELKDNYKDNGISLTNILNDVDQIKAEYDSSSKIEQKNISNINTSNLDMLNELEFDPTITESVLANIKNDEYYQTDYDNKKSDINKINLENINLE